MPKEGEKGDTVRRILVLLVFVVGVGAGLWLSLFDSEESQRPRVYAEKEARDFLERRPGDAPLRSFDREALPDVAGAPANRSASPPARRADPEPARASRPPEDATRGLPGDRRSPPVPDAEPLAEQEPSEQELERERLEEVAASVALRLGLIAPRDLEQRVEREVPAGSLPPDILEGVRDEVRQKILSERTIVEYLARRHAGPDAQYAQLQDARDWAMTLLPMQDDEYLDKVLADVAEDDWSDEAQDDRE